MQNIIMVKLDERIKSFRRWMEKEENRRVSYAEAENKYKTLIKASESVENYAKIKTDFENWYNKHIHEKYRAGQEEPTRLFDKIAREYIINRRMGKIDQNINLLDFAKQYAVGARHERKIAEGLLAEKMNPAQKALLERRTLSKPEEIESMARECGYEFGKNTKEGLQVINPATGKVIIVIPKHPVKGSGRTILEKLAAGDSNRGKREE